MHRDHPFWRQQPNYAVLVDTREELFAGELWVENGSAKNFNNWRFELKESEIWKILCYFFLKIICYFLLRIFLSIPDLFDCKIFTPDTRDRPAPQITYVPQVRKNYKKWEADHRTYFDCRKILKLWNTPRFFIPQSRITSKILTGLNICQDLGSAQFTDEISSLNTDMKWVIFVKLKSKFV